MKRVSLIFAAIMLLVYFGFMYCFAFENSLIGQEIVPGLTVGLLAGPAVIIVGVALSFVYVLIANNLDSRSV